MYKIEKCFQFIFEWVSTHHISFNRKTSIPKRERRTHCFCQCQLSNGNKKKVSHPYTWNFLFILTVKTRGRNIVILQLHYLETIQLKNYCEISSLPWYHQHKDILIPKMTTLKWMLLHFFSLGLCKMSLISERMRLLGLYTCLKIKKKN